MTKMDILEDTEELEDFDAEDQDDDEEELDDDQDDDESDDDDEEEEESPKKKKSGGGGSSAKQIAELKNMIANLSKGGSSEQQKKMSRVEKEFARLIGEGTKPEQLSALFNVITGLKEDLKEEAQKEREERSVQKLGDRCMERMEDEFSRLAEKNPQLKWSRAEIINRAIAKMQRSSSFTEARTAFNQGRVPAAGEFRKAISAVIQTYQKETGTNSRSKTESLDIGSSKLKGKPTKTTESGEPDLESLSEFEREIYVATKNSTGSKKMALEALKDIRAGLKGSRK